MTLPANWRKSSRSQNGGNCVEVRNDLGAVRDTKNPAVELQVKPEQLLELVKFVR